jgi:hypothetical protein
VTTQVTVLISSLPGGRSLLKGPINLERKRRFKHMLLFFFRCSLDVIRDGE